MDHLMQANLQIIELLGAVFAEVERQEERRRTEARPGCAAAVDDHDAKEENRWR